MAATTKNIGLTKPAEEEFYDINVQNGNMDIIDKEIGELKNPIFASSDVADGEATEWTSVEVLTSKEKHTSVLAKISQMFKNIRFLNNKYKELNQSLTELSGAEYVANSEQSNIATFDTSSWDDGAYLIFNYYVVAGSFFELLIKQGSNIAITNLTRKSTVNGTVVTMEVGNFWCLLFRKCIFR